MKTDEGSTEPQPDKKMSKRNVILIVIAEIVVFGYLIFAGERCLFLEHLPPSGAAYRSCLQLVEAEEPNATLLGVEKAESVKGWSIRYEVRTAEYSGERVLRCNVAPDGENPKLEQF